MATLAETGNAAVVIGSGPNGLAAGILLARAGMRVTVQEGSDQIGGGARSEELTLPGFVHDVCSAIHPMAKASPCFEQFDLPRYGLEWVEPNAPLAHPLDDGTAVMLERSIDATARNLGADGSAWSALMEPLASNWEKLRGELLAPLHVPRHPWVMARFGLHAIRSMHALADSLFHGVRARALMAGLGAHSLLPLETRPSAAVGLVLGLAAHTVGWPFPKGGARHIPDALAACLKDAGGEIRTGSWVKALPEERPTLCDVTPRQFLALAGAQLPEGFRRKMADYRYGPGVFKLDYALSAPIPWTARECARAATVHLGGTLEEIAEWERGYTGRPFVLLVQHTLFDPSRAPAGKHTVWAYCHAPNGSKNDYADAIESQIERFAPGFRKVVLARHILTPANLEQRNPNLVGGDVNGGAGDLRQFFLRPTRLLYRTPLRGVYLCSSSTPPSGAVHGMCGYNAVQAALADLGRR